MKRVIFGLLMLTAISASAQEFKPLKLNLSLGYPTIGGILLSAEPKYGLSDQIDLGFRYELGLMGRPYTLNGEEARSELKASSSYLITGNYLLSQGTFRPFVGAGVGLFTLVSISFSEGSGSTDGGISGGRIIQ